MATRYAAMAMPAASLSLLFHDAGPVPAEAWGQERAGERQVAGPGGSVGARV